MPGHARRGLFPGVAGLGHAETEIVELAHIDRGEGLRAGIEEVARDVGKIVVDVVFLGEDIELVEIADALALDQARYREIDSVLAFTALYSARHGRSG